MDEQIVIQRVKAILCEVLNLDTIDDHASRAMYPEWDSMAYLSVLSALEDEFQISITEDTINGFDSIPNILKNHTKTNPFRGTYRSYNQA
ncbi:MAG: acyl carrier protein [bacterium]|nr:acyl carrier protein [bacterium]